MSRTNTGRGKRKYYLSKYLQFLIPYTKTRLKHTPPGSMMALRKYSTSANHLVGLGDDTQTPSSHTPLPTPPPMTCISHMPLPIVSSDETKDSNSSDVAAIAEDDIVVSLVDNMETQHTQQLQQQQLQPQSQPQQQEQPQQPQQQNMVYNIHNRNNTNYSINSRQDSSNNNNSNGNGNGYYNKNQHFQHATTTLQQQLQQQIQQHHQPLRLPAIIKSEPRAETNSNSPTTDIRHTTTYGNNTAAAASITAANKNSTSASINNNNNSGFTSAVALAGTTTSNSRATIQSSTAMATVDLSEFADWIKNKNVNMQRQYATTAAPASAPLPDADQSFLNSLHPFLMEMSGKQNRRFRQKVVALIDAILDNAD